jgi:hypothetical protein
MKSHLGNHPMLIVRAQDQDARRGPGRTLPTRGGTLAARGYPCARPESSTVTRTTKSTGTNHRSEGRGWFLARPRVFAGLVQLAAACRDEPRFRDCICSPAAAMRPGDHRRVDDPAGPGIVRCHPAFRDGISQLSDNVPLPQFPWWRPRTNSRLFVLEYITRAVSSTANNSTRGRPRCVR